MTISGVFEKDADAVLDYKFDWAAFTNNSPGGVSDWLSSGETISTGTGDVVITITPSETGGLTLDSYSLTDSDTSVTVWLSGGQVGIVYYVSCKVTTTANRTDERTLQIDITGLSNVYATLQEMKDVDILNLKDTTHDSVIEREIEAASRKIDEFCGRTFYNVTVAEIRYFTPERGNLVDIDDIYSTTDLAISVDSNRDGLYDLDWSSSDYSLWPYNPKNGRPWVRIETTLARGYQFLCYPKSLKITALWGWSSVPVAINQACIMLAHRLHKRNTTVLGQAGASAVGTLNLTIPKVDPDIMQLLLDYRKTYT